MKRVKIIVALMMTITFFVSTAALADTKYTGYVTIEYLLPKVSASGESYITVRDNAGQFQGNCGGEFGSWGYVGPDHPNKKELYALFVASALTGVSMTCKYETNPQGDPGGCAIEHCTLKSNL